jgi:hypothetical protein
MHKNLCECKEIECKSKVMVMAHSLCAFSICGHNPRGAHLSILVQAFSKDEAWHFTTT